MGNKGHCYLLWSKFWQFGGLSQHIKLTLAVNYPRRWIIKDVATCYGVNVVIWRAEPTLKLSLVLSYSRRWVIKDVATCYGVSCYKLGDRAKMYAHPGYLSKERSNQGMLLWRELLQFGELQSQHMLTLVVIYPRR